MEILDLTPNSPKYHKNNKTTDNKDDYWWDLGSERVTDWFPVIKNIVP